MPRGKGEGNVSRVPADPTLPLKYWQARIEQKEKDMNNITRDDIIRILDENDPEGGVTDPDERDDFWGRQADAILALLKEEQG